MKVEHDGFIQSTDVYRTITSGYSELLGFIDISEERLQLSDK